jgi:2-dehydropantoate 2-reductase
MHILRARHPAGLSRLRHPRTPFVKAHASFEFIGSGGVGGYFGARLARAGNETIFVARGQHIEAIRRDGLRIEEPNESFVVRAAATDDTNEIGRVDYIVSAVKLWDAEAAAQACRCLVDAETAILPL